MQRFKRILFVANGEADAGPALERTLALARRNKARLSLVEVVPALAEEGWTRSADTRRRLQELMVEGRLAVLEKLRSAAAEEGIEVEVEVLTGTPFLELIYKVQRDEHDLLVKVAEGRHGALSSFLGSTDLHLLRKCPCPVWVVKGGGSGAIGRILVAVDPRAEAAEHPRHLDRTLLELATSLARLEGAELHVAHAWSLFGEQLLRGRFSRLSHGEMDRLLSEMETEHRQALTGLLQRYVLDDIPHQVHLVKGEPAEVVSHLVGELKVDLLVMGTVSRTGIEGLIVGNTAERVFGSVDCSLLTVKPPGFVSPVR